VPNKIKLQVGGIEYVLNSNDDESYVRYIGEEVHHRLEVLKEQNAYLSTTMIAVLSALEYCDEAKKANMDAEKLRQQLKSYVEDAACARLEAEEARREIERLNKELLSRS